MLFAIAATGCGDDYVDTTLDGGAADGSVLDARLDTEETTAAVDPSTGYDIGDRLDGSVRVTTPTGEVCYAYPDTGSLVTSVIRKKNGLICILVGRELIVDDSVCVAPDAGLSVFTPEGQECAWGLVSIRPE